MTNEEYIITNREADVRSLALKKVPEGVNALWCLQQIEGYQIAKKKLPHWASVKDLWYPPRLSMEQCSSEQTAEYKQHIVQRLAAQHRHSQFTDITGGFGVDFSYMAKGFDKAIYVEQQEQLCLAALHNMPLLGIPNAVVRNMDGTTYLEEETARREGQDTANYVSIIYTDPARRSVSGRKTIAIEDCTPNIAELQHTILSIATYAVIKLSPMLDITQALRTLKGVREIHIVSVKGECKELLFVLYSKASENDDITCHCANLGTRDSLFSCPLTTNSAPQLLSADANMTGMALYEPNASIMKAGVQDKFATAYGLQKLHPMSHLYVSPETAPDDIPARRFRITAVSDFSKSGIKEILGSARQGNLTVRNFPNTVAELRKRLKIKEGGSDYLFATTLSNGKHALIKCCAL